MMKAGKSQIYGRHAVGGLIAAVWLIIQLQSCAEVPVTQRKGLHLVPETKIADIRKYLPEALPYIEKRSK